MKKTKNYKIKLEIFLIAIIAVVALFIWGNVHHKNMDGLPSLEQVAQMKDEADLNRSITQFTRAELKIVWGEPNESNANEDIWYINSSTNLIVNYHNKSDTAVVCGIIKMK